MMSERFKLNFCLKCIKMNHELEHLDKMRVDLNHICECGCHGSGMEDVFLKHLPVKENVI